MEIPDLPEMHQELESDYGLESQWRGQGSEVSLCRERLIKWCNGKGLDLGCGPSKISPEVIGIDDSDRSMSPMVRDISNLECFGDSSFDFVFSSHALEDIQDTAGILKEWIRVLKSGGYLVLYCPDKQYYYNIGHPRYNVRHKHDFYWWDICRIINEINPKTVLEHYARYGPVYKVGEWSWELVIKKL